jgi:predicted metal-binding membrane protein
VAAAWQLTPVKQRAVWSCQRTAPLAPRGWRADRDCVRFGWDIGRRCLVSCWAMMLACSLAGHSVPAMTLAGLCGAAERYASRPTQHVIAGVLAGVALLYAILALRGS